MKETPTTRDIIVDRLANIRSGKEQADSALVEALLAMLEVEEQKTRK